ncbi:T9SS type A sorting domain-containing protein [Rasiella rasia]|uniref:T9SS type A sorting domain-containing protein n=1 Tax=Rasiella rasia TaxID=2744027 RepID=A0A6G6GNH4_9FLAO|nr:T9SS type A sorting domain-containing protein [Rasiella rasia]QIE59963.1 T9SS type A sorting domain-containing protein [Rasiella rasia]
MKSIFTLVACFMFTVVSLAQDPNLAGSSWFLESITIDGVEYSIPSTGGDPDLLFEISEFFLSPPTLRTGFCNGFNQTVQYSSGSDLSFVLSNNPDIISGSCTEPESLTFDAQFLSIFYQNETTAKNPFVYEIINNGTTNTKLEITNGEGDKVLFDDNLLSTNNVTVNRIDIFPNPVKNHLNFTSTVLLKFVHIFDIHGREVYTTRFQQNNPKINTETLKAGVYFIKAESDTGEQLIAKFVKV